MPQKKKVRNGEQIIVQIGSTSLWAYLIECLFLVNKQINDKERIAAAMENPKLKEMVESCIKEED